MSTQTQNVSRRTFVAGAATVVAAGTAMATTVTARADEAAEAEATPAGTPEHRWQSQAAADWRVAPEPVAEDQIADGGTYDVVIVGGGQAGTWTARSAAMNGASVCVIEAVPEDTFMYIGGEVAVINSEWALAKGADQVDKEAFMNMWLQRNASRTNQTEDTFMYIGGEVAVINSEWALAKGADQVDKEAFMNMWLQRNASRTNQRLIRNFYDYSGQIMDWSISEIDEVEPDYYHNDDRTNIYSAESDDRMVMNPSGYQFYKSTIMHRPVDQGGAGWEWGKVVMTHHRNKAIEDGAVWNFGTYADYLEKDETGRVTAVIAHNRETNEYARYNATRGVVLTAGDFQGNVDMLRDINDEYRHLAENYGDIELATAGGMGLRDGSGIKLGVWVGGHVETGPRTGMNTGQSGPWESAPWGPGFMLVNQRGYRFCNECAGGTEGSGYASSRQPKGSIVSIADANWADTVYCMPPAHGSINLTSQVTFHGIDPLTEQMAALDPNAEGPTEAGVYCANTIEELFDKIGCFTPEQKANALAEVEKWNAYCEAGRDEDFAMDPRIMHPLTTAPFYAVTGNAQDIYVGLCQTTGLDTDFNGCVLDSDLMPIPGLYSAGTAPFYAVTGNAQDIYVGLCQTTGLDTDFNGCVLDSDLMPIPGLYSAGNNSGNRYIVNYCTPISGMSLGLCMTEGVLLGHRLATTEAAQTEA